MLRKLTSLRILKLNLDFPDMPSAEECYPGYGHSTRTFERECAFEHALRGYATSLAHVCAPSLEEVWGFILFYGPSWRIYDVVRSRESSSSALNITVELRPDFKYYEDRSRG